MRAPSILAQCIPGLMSHDRTTHAITNVPDKDHNFPSPAVEIVPSKTAHPYKYAGENVELQGLNIFKGRVSVSDIINFSSSETIHAKPDGFLKCWESSIDLVNCLKHEIRDGQLSFRGKRVLELNCGYGLSGIFACLKGASAVHFQDLNAETVRCSTIPNVLANLEQARDRQSRQPETESPITPSRQSVTAEVHFYAGDFEELDTVLSVVKKDGIITGMSQCFSEEDFMDGCSSQDGSILVGQESSPRRSRKSGSRAWERANESDLGEGGYDVIMMTEIQHSLTCLKKLYALIKKCLRPPYGVLYLTTKKSHHIFHGSRNLRNVVDEEGIFGIHMVTEMSDREIWKFFFK